MFEQVKHIMRYSIATFIDITYIKQHCKTCLKRIVACCFYKHI